MQSSLEEDPIIRKVVRWAEERDAVRAVLLTSTRAVPGGASDAFSDYDVILVVRDILPFFEDRSWLEDFGLVLVVYRDPILPMLGLGKFAYITQYETGLKIDFMLFPVELIQRIEREQELPDVLDVGYQVLLDKDGITEGLKSPTYRAHIPSPPTEDEYLNVIHEFFHESTYVAKHLWRDHLLPAKYNLDERMKQVNLRYMLEWLVETEHGWSVKPGAYGKGLKKRLPAYLWEELEATYVGAAEAENWEALFATIRLFRKVAVQVGDALGYEYPYGLEERVVQYLRRVKELDRNVKTFRE